MTTTVTLTLLCATLMTFAPAALGQLTALTPCPNNFFYDAVYNLDDMTKCPSYWVSEVSPPVTPANCECCSRMTLNMTLDPRSRRAVLVDLWLHPEVLETGRTQWTFNLGDSKSNNGYRGDSGHTSYDAELHPSGGDGFTVYSSDKGAAAGEGPSVGVPNVLTRRISLVVQNGAVQWVSEPGMDYLRQVGLFSFWAAGDSEAGGSADGQLYLGLNQVISGSRRRSGRGLCRAAVRFLGRENKLPPKPFPTKPLPVLPVKPHPVKPVLPVKPVVPVEPRPVKPSLPLEPVKPNPKFPPVPRRG